MQSSTIMRVNGHPIAVDKEGYICLTDMAKAKFGEEKAASIISRWLKTKSAIDYLGLWESDNNVLFRRDDFQKFSMVGDKKNFWPTVSFWVEKTSAIGMYVQLDKKERVYAHRDIAYEFGTAISVEFRYMVFKEYQRFKEREANKNNPEWNFKRLMAKFNYVVHTDAIKRFRIPFASPSSHPFIYSSEADMINKVLFGITAKEWREQHIDLVAKNQNLREFASENELVVLSNLEVLNAEMMADGVDIAGRKAKLTEASKRYMDALNNHIIQKSFRKTAFGEFKPMLKLPGDKAA